MLEKREEATDLSLPKLLTMSPEDIKKEILEKKENLERIATDERHVRILVYHMLRFNIKAIDDFNKTSKRASNVLVFLSIAMTVVVLVQLLVAILGK